MNTPEIEELKRLVEEHYGKHLTTTTDFEEFSVILRLRHEIFVSPSTLKRLYGYVSDSHKPRMLTLDSLSAYIGHKDYASFLLWLKKSSYYNSSFFDASRTSSRFI